MAAEWILWAGTVGLDAPLEGRVAAALASGCTAVSVGFNDVHVAQQQGVTASDLGKQLRGLGVTTVVVDAITTWVEGTWAATGDRVRADEGMAIAEDLGARSVNVVAIGRGPWSRDAIVDRFGGLCDRAADFGASVHIEFAPESGVPDLATAWDIVEAAGRPNGGVLFDTWHFHRSDPDLELLARIPGNRILAVQVSDAGAQVIGTMWDDTLHHRLLPGDGVIDLAAIFTSLGTDGLTLVGPEVFSDELQAQPLHDAAVAACNRTRAAVAAALGQDWDR